MDCIATRRNGEPCKGTAKYGPDGAYCWNHDPERMEKPTGALTQTEIEVILSDIARTATNNPAARLGAIKELQALRGKGSEGEEAKPADPDDAWAALDAHPPRLERVK